MNVLDLKKLAQDFEKVEQFFELIPIMEKMPPVEVAEILMEAEAFYRAEILLRFSEDFQGAVFAEMPIVAQLDFFQGLSKRKFASIFSAMPSDSRADFFQHLTQSEQAEILPFIPKKIREDVIALSAYPPDTAGGIMSTDYASIGSEMTCEEALGKIRQDNPSQQMVNIIYVLDYQKILLGYVTLKDLIMVPPKTLVSEIYHTEFQSVTPTVDRERVAEIIEKYDLLALPVINKESQLLGIITQDEAIDVIRAEHTEDMEKFMGIAQAASEFDYLETSSWIHFKKRAIWVVSLAALGLISGVIIHSYENALEKLLILALYMPMVADTGGNSGSQAATVVVRALALGQIKVSQWFMVLWKEARVSLLMALVLGLLAFGKVLFLSWDTEVPAEYSLINIAAVISFALSLQVITATVIGAGLPLLVRRFGGDPAVAASPAITTVVDITGLLIYFGVATLFFTL